MTIEVTPQNFLTACSVLTATLLLIQRFAKGAMTTYILNLFDLACTLYAMSIGVAELNPLFRDPKTIPVMFVYKVFIVGGLLWWLNHRPERIAHIGLRVCAVAYTVLAVWHIAGLAMILCY